MFRIKICGVTSPNDAQLAAAAGADAIGLNFFAGSKRYLTPEKAGTVAVAIPSGVLKVGVFVNAEVEFVCRESDRLRLDLIQLAGDEPPEFVANLGDRPTMKVFRPRIDREDVLAQVAEFLDRCDTLGCMPKLALVDAYQAGEYGGTGKAIDWPAIVPALNALGRTTPPFVLAGGLTPQNVFQAILVLRPAAVDVASGVERSPGVKDPKLVQMFVGAARRGFACADAPQRPSSSLKPQASNLPPKRP